MSLTSNRPETYAAAILCGAGHVDLVELPYPSCGDDEAIVRNALAGISGSDIFASQKYGAENRIWIGEEFGDEAISEVVELDKDVKGLQVGDRVFRIINEAIVLAAKADEAQKVCISFGEPAFSHG